MLKYIKAARHRFQHAPPPPSADKMPCTNGNSQYMDKTSNSPMNPTPTPISPPKTVPVFNNHVHFPVVRHGSKQYNISSTGVHCHATIKIYYQNTRNSFGAVRLRHVQPECINLLPCQQYDDIHAQWRIISLLTESEEPRWRFFLPQRQTRQYSKNPISPLSSTSQYSLSAKSSVTQWSPLRRPRLLQFSSSILRQYPTEALSQNLAILNLPHLSKLTIQPVLVSQMIPQNKNAPSPSTCASTAYRTAHHKPIHSILTTR